MKESSVVERYEQTTKQDTNPGALFTEYFSSLGINNEMIRKFICSANNMVWHLILPANEE